jgi:hypothetical protein
MAPQTRSTTLMKFGLEDGGDVTVEVDDAPRGGPVVRGGRSRELVLESGQSLEHAVGRITPAVSAVVQRFRSGDIAPHQIELELGVKLSAEVGAIISRTAGEANIKLTLRWLRPVSEGGTA